MNERLQIDGSTALKKPVPRLITIEPTKKTESIKLRVAAYTRVSTSSDDQLNSFAAQNQYYMARIAENQNWELVDIYADEGISGTSIRKRTEFQRMIADCRKGKIDRILVKSISRFARNTAECLVTLRELKLLGVSVSFEKENINTLKADSELLITMMGAFAQAESESISANVRWGKRQAMREGRIRVSCANLYAYENGPDGQMQIIPEQAEVVRRIFRLYLSGASLRMIKNVLETEKIPNVYGNMEWRFTTIRYMLKNEKYCGDVLLQKTFRTDCISRKVVQNKGQLPMYLIQDHHEAIIDRKTFQAAQAELARRRAAKSPSKKCAPTGRSCYASKYALSERLACGECGTLYRRCTWAKKGKKRVVWRCVSRLDYGTKYCHNSPSMEEEPLQRAILAAINSTMRDKQELIQEITEAMELELPPLPGVNMGIVEIEKQLDELNKQTRALVTQAAHAENAAAYAEQLKIIMDEAAALKEKRAEIEELQQENSQANLRIETAAAVMEKVTAEITQWDESVIRGLVDTVKVVSKDQIEVYLRGGSVVKQEVRN